MQEKKTVEEIKAELEMLFQKKDWAWEDLSQVLWLAPFFDTDFIPSENAPESIMLSDEVRDRADKIFAYGQEKGVELLARLELMSGKVVISKTISRGSRHSVSDLSTDGEVAVGDFHIHLETVGGFSTGDFFSSNGNKLSLLRDAEGFYLLMEVDSFLDNYDQIYLETLREVASRYGVQINEEGQPMTGDDTLLAAIEVEVNQQMPAALGFILYKEDSDGVLRRADQGPAEKDETELGEGGIN